jgi:antitoxin ParD1/3/4
MARQSISFTKPNDEWLKEQVNNEEYSSKSELINDLVRQARKQQPKGQEIKDKLESSAFNDDSKSQILEQIKSPVIG